LSKNKIDIISELDTVSRYFELFQLLDPNNLHELATAAVYFSNLKTEQKSQLRVENRWLYNISPVFLYPDMDQLVLASDLSQQISDSEASEICLSINNLFSETEYDKTWELVYFAQNQWFLISDMQLINQAMPKDKIGKALVRPQAVDDFPNNTSNYWIQTLNEIQMLLFSLPLNQLRLQESKQQCNSLWLWGESLLTLDKSKEKKHCWDKVYSNEYLVQQLAMYNGQCCQTLSDFESIVVDTTTENILVVLNDIEQAIETQDLFAIIDVLKQYETQWFEPLKQSIMSSSIESVCIQSNAKESFRINRRSLKSWWKRTKSTGQIFESFL
jgi:hypothetical protein